MPGKKSLRKQLFEKARSITHVKERNVVYGVDIIGDIIYVYKKEYMLPRHGNHIKWVFQVTPRLKLASIEHYKVGMGWGQPYTFIDKREFEIKDLIDLFRYKNAKLVFESLQEAFGLETDSEVERILEQIPIDEY